MKRNLFILSSLLTATIVLGLGEKASAAQIIVHDVTSSWHTPTMKDNVGSPTIVNGDPLSTIYWGNGARSGYEFTKTVPGQQTVPPATSFFPLGTFRHVNEPGVNPSLTSIKLDVNMQMTVDGTPISRTFTYTIKHEETNNSFPCTYTATDGVPCDDRVTIVSEPNPQTFNAGGVDYTLAINFADENGDPVAGFLTKEDTINPANLRGSFTLPGTVNTPTFNPNGGSFTSAQQVTMDCTTPNSQIYYTTNGSNPTVASTHYTGPITLSASTVLNAIAVAPGLLDSAVATANFSINVQGVVATPTFNPNGGTFVNSVSVTINTATSGATIKYTKDGSDPRTSPTAITGTSLNVTANGTLKAFAFKAGMTNSAVATSNAFTISMPPPVITSIVVSPKTAFVRPNEQLPFTAKVYDQYGALMSVSVNWSSTGGNIAGGALGTAAFTAPQDMQSITVTASAGGKSDTANVRIVAANAGESLADAKLGPVPFKGNSGDSGITFRDLPPDTKIRIFTMTGRLVQTIDVPNGGNQLWDVRNANFDKVASGVYFYMIENYGQKKEGKLVIIQ